MSQHQPSHKIQILKELGQDLTVNARAGAHIHCLGCLVVVMRSLVVLGMGRAQRRKTPAIMCPYVPHVIISLKYICFRSPHTLLSLMISQKSIAFSVPIASLLSASAALPSSLTWRFPALPRCCPTSVTSVSCCFRLTYATYFTSSWAHSWRASCTSSRSRTRGLGLAHGIHGTHYTYCLYLAHVTCISWTLGAALSSVELTVCFRTLVLLLQNGASARQQAWGGGQPSKILRGFHVRTNFVIIRVGHNESRVELS
ncbi:hypothetical protein BJV74DRAFT_283667 [Russula compacta]|nr:hypothetical protein BJV74DRAFT_283667 [Russula compacta]